MCLIFLRSLLGDCKCNQHIQHRLNKQEPFNVSSSGSTFGWKSGSDISR